MMLLNRVECFPAICMQSNQTSESQRWVKNSSSLTEDEMQTHADAKYLFDVVWVSKL